MQPFQVDFSPAILHDLRNRLAHTRWPASSAAGGWQRGTNQAYLQELTAYW